MSNSFRPITPIRPSPRTRGRSSRSRVPSARSVPPAPSSHRTPGRWVGAHHPRMKYASSREETLMQVRFARHTSRLAELVRFYRDGLGLPELGRFENHDGYDGVFLDLPGTNAHLEFTSGGEHLPPVAHAETLLVLYLGGEHAV